MTCIVAVKATDGTIWMGGDSAGVGNGDITLRADTKVFRVGEFVIGFTTSFRMGQLLQYSFEPPHIEGDDLHRYMCTKFINAVRECLKDGGFASKKDDSELGGCFIVGIRGRIFTIDEDYQVGESHEGYDTVGCGMTYAKGALLALSSVPVERGRYMVETALIAAAHFSTGVRAPFQIINSRAA